MANDFKTLGVQFNRALNELVGKREFEVLGRKMAKRIRQNVRLSRGGQLNTPFGKRTKFEQLADITIEIRKQSADILSPLTRPAQKRSNATFTGQMIDSIKSRAIGRDGFELYFDGDRDDGLTNEEVAERFQQARPFFQFSGPEFKGLINELSLRLTRKLNKLIK